MPKDKEEKKNSDLEERSLVRKTDSEHQQMLATMRRIEKARKFPMFQNGRPLGRKGQDDFAAFGMVMEVCKTDDINVALSLVRGAAVGQLVGKTSDQEMGQALKQMAELKPQTHLEAILVSQMVAVNTATTKILQAALLPGQDSLGNGMNLNYVTKLQRTFLQQIDVLQKIRGKGQQTVRVEHVTVNTGGQAIVGNVEHGGARMVEGEDEK